MRLENAVKHVQNYRTPPREKVEHWFNWSISCIWYCVSKVIQKILALKLHLEKGLCTILFFFSKSFFQFTDQYWCCIRHCRSQLMLSFQVANSETTILHTASRTRNRRTATTRTTEPLVAILVPSWKEPLPVVSMVTRQPGARTSNRTGVQLTQRSAAKHVKNTKTPTPYQVSWYRTAFSDFFQGRAKIKKMRQTTPYLLILCCSRLLSLQ